jgi:hypothetical protein
MITATATLFFSSFLYMLLPYAKYKSKHQDSKAKKKLTNILAYAHIGQTPPPTDGE